MNSEILIVEDDKDIQSLLAMCFDQEGLIYRIVDNGMDAIRVFNLHNISLVILDIMLPDIDGFQICEEIRKTSAAPILFLSCKNTDQDKIVGFSIGADDYIEKPFSVNVLLARVRAHLRRNRLLARNNRVEGQSDTFEFDNISIDVRSREVKKKGKTIHLTTKEFDLLLFLLKNRNNVFSAEDLLYRIWGCETYSEIRTVVVHISSLRKKFEDNPLNPKYIVTIRGAGYKFVQNK
ncbi:response regulator transcription factor [Fredinandcohnia humi]